MMKGTLDLRYTARRAKAGRETIHNGAGGYHHLSILLRCSREEGSSLFYSSVLS